MKTKHYALGLVALVAAGGIWIGRGAWRRQHQLVSLDLHNVPLLEVLQRIEGQTGQKIRAEHGLDTRVTMRVVDKPLAYVLDWLAEQAGGRWSTVYAVYESGRALSALESALRGDGRIEAAGWNKIAPTLPMLNLKGPDGLGDLPTPGATPQIRKLESGPGPGPGLAVTATEDVIATGPPDGKPGEHGPITLRVVRRGGMGGADSVEEEIWTAEELVMESGLSSRLGDQHSDAATPAAAEATARKVRGRWTTFIALRKSSSGFAFSGISMPPPARRQVEMPGPGHEPKGTNLNGQPEEWTPPPMDFQAAAQRERNDHFARLTPEQRVQRARQRLESNQN